MTGNVIPGAAQEGVGAFAEPFRNRMLLPIDDPPDRLYGLIAHELTHGVTQCSAAWASAAAGRPAAAARATSDDCEYDVARPRKSAHFHQRAGSSLVTAC